MRCAEDAAHLKSTKRLSRSQSTPSSACITRPGASSEQHSSVLISASTACCLYGRASNIIKHANVTDAEPVLRT
jgi:hypothetical protein